MYYGRRLITPEAKRLARGDQTTPKRVKQKGWVVESAEGVRFAYTATPIREKRSDLPQKSLIQKVLAKILPQSVTVENIPEQNPEQNLRTHSTVQPIGTFIEVDHITEIQGDPGYTDAIKRQMREPTGLYPGDEY